MKPIEILLVEDNPGDALLIQLMLREAGAGKYNLTRVGRLSEGLARIDAGGADIMLLDLNLPDSQGLETVARAQSHAERIPIIVLTGVDDEDTCLEAVKMGAQDFLTKGAIDGSLLIRSIRYAIERKALESHLTQAQKVEAIGQLAAGIAHEINTPIQYIGDNTRFLQEAFANISRLLA